MLLKLKAKLLPAKIVLLHIVFVILSLNAFSQQSMTHDLQLHGFAAQGGIYVDGSDFVNESGHLSPELTELGINASYQLNSQLRLTGQVVYLNGGNRYDDGFRFDYALLDWSAYYTENWQVNFYLGRYKNYHWLYSSTRDIPFTRPSVILPQSVYFDGFRDISVGADGLALKISHSSDYWGDFDFNLSTGTSSISDEQTQIILSEHAKGKMKHDFDLQTSIYWQPALSSWRFGLALLDSDFTYYKNESIQVPIFTDADIVLQRVILNTMYEGENWEFSAEVFQERFVFDGFYYPSAHRDQKGLGYYVQSRYKIANDLTLLARYENFYANKDDKKGLLLENPMFGGNPRYFGYQNDVTLGLSYDLDETVRFQLEYHNIEGTARLTPVVLPNKEMNDSKYWQMWAMQIMYWF